MKHAKKDVFLIVCALFISVLLFQIPVHAKKVENGGSTTVQQGTKVGFKAGSGSSEDSIENDGESIEERESTGGGKKTTPGSSSSSDSYKSKPGSSGTNSSHDEQMQIQLLLSQGYELRQVSGHGMQYAKSAGTKKVGNYTLTRYIVKNSKGQTLGYATPGGSQRILVLEKTEPKTKPKPVITTSTSTTKGNTYTKKIRTVRYDWTIENVSDKSTPTVKRSTEKPTYTHTFNHTGKYYIEAVPYCYYEQGYDETTTTTTRRDGKVISRKYDTKFVKTKSYYAHDTNNKSTFTVVVTLDDVGKPIKLPPDPGRGDPEGSNVKPVYELVE